MDDGSPMSAPVDVAYYYPEPYWHVDEVDALKTLLLFFDRIAILLPRYMRGIEVGADPVLAGPLQQAGLLQVLEPEEFLDQEMAQSLSDALLPIVCSGGFDHLDRAKHFQALSRSRLGWDADVELASQLAEELQARGLATKPHSYDRAIPLHPTVRMTVLVLLSQLARRAGRNRGLELHPTTSQPGVVSALTETLSLPSMPSVGRVVALDAQTVALDLSSVPLDEVLAFRSEYGEAFRRYARDVRATVAALSAVDDVDRERLLQDRQEEFRERAEELSSTARKAWAKSMASVVLGGAGAAWNYQAGDLLSALLAAAGGLLGTQPSQPQASAYSYLLAAKDSLPRRTGRGA